MVRPRCPQRSLAEMWFRDSVDDCWQPWMRQAEELLDDPQLVEPVYEALGRPLAAEPPAGPGGHPSGSRLAAVGVEARPQLELRCAALQREVKANLVYRLFTRSGAEKVPAAKTLAKIALALGPQVIGQIHQRLLAMAQEKQAVPGKNCAWTPPWWRSTCTTRLIIDYQVDDQRPHDADLLLPPIEVHKQRLGRLPRLVAGGAGFYSPAKETPGQQRGVKRVAIPHRSSRSPARRRHQKKRWFRQGQKWSTGSEGGISLLQRRHGLHRCCYRGEEGMQRWVGLGVIADNLINIGRHLAACDSR